MARSLFGPDVQSRRQLESGRDVYGFTVLPQHLKRYREYADIYKVEEAERSERWENFLKTFGAGSEKDLPVDCKLEIQAADEQAAAAGRHATLAANKANAAPGRFDTWDDVRLSLLPIEEALNVGIKTTGVACAPLSVPKSDDLSAAVATLSTEVEHAENGDQSYSPERCEEGTEEEFYDVERSQVIQDGVQPDLMLNCHATSSDQGIEPIQGLCPVHQELEALVRGGVPMALRGELWQVFVGTRIRRVQGHYNALLTLLADGGGDSDGVGGLCSGGMSSSNYTLSKSGILEKWTGQIEKDLPRTFPGHPALDEDGCNALRRLLTAYARHNPDVGYCQAMNFFAALLLLMMPEENAFWTLTAVIDDYFKGYYSENMVEAQVDQLVFEELIQEHFPKLVSHLEKLGVQVTLVSGPWFLSIFVNILPWETVLRIWDVLLFEGNRSMLFRIALALMELHGPAIISTKDAGDALFTLQSLASASFDSSELVLVACMGYQMVDETRLQDLRMRHRPKVLASLDKRLLELRPWCNSHGLVTSKLYNCTSDTISNGVQKSGNIVSGSDSTRYSTDKDGAVEFLQCDSETPSECNPLSHGGDIAHMDDDDTRKGILNEEVNDASDLLEQVKWLKIELCQALEENKAATLRAQELETAFMELVQEDNRRLLSAKVETLKAETTELKQKLAEKEEQEKAIVQVMLRMEQEQLLAENACQFAEQDAAAQRHTANLLQVKYENVLIELSSMEKRAIVAENMLEGLLQYQAFHAGQFTASEESSKWFWSHIPFSPQDADPALPESGTPLLTHKQDSEELFKEQCRQCTDITNQLHLDDPPQKHGLFSHPFFVSWRDRQKGKERFQDLQLPTISFAHAREPQYSNNSVSISSQNGFDISQPSTPSQDDSCYYLKASVPNGMVHLNDSITNMAAKSQQVTCNGSPC